MTTPLTISVTGLALTSNKPELALLSVEICCTGSSRSFVSSELQLSCRGLEDLLLKTSVVSSSTKNQSMPSGNPSATAKPIVKHWSMTDIHTSSHLPTDTQGAVLKNAQRSYTTSVSYAIHIAEFGALGTFANQISILPYTSIQGVKWSISSTTCKAHEARLRKEAVEDALESAKDYAKALGLSAVWPVEVKEVQWEKHDVETKTKRTRRPVSADTDPASMESFFEPGEVTLSARVDCKFEAE
ncbi:hypothetical protein E4T50_08014 [Aureobasidium sp. EXF-12298]|nr:hypothetical protein E4T50_08014 [Aureobasidium sp. EXF-12298]KAI4763121.1 hypothetical protein E4T51_03893 [Aureobasidium sp. EXF-12344]KAI4780198.1 hypothetical protein E4T52_04865 [Aureobasidium sp. EXF-3400]